MVAGAVVLLLGVVFAATEGPRLVSLVRPAGSAAAAADLDRCLVGYWVEDKREQPRPIREDASALFTSSGSVWGFGTDGRATLYLGSTVARLSGPGPDTIGYLSEGTIRWRATTVDGFLGLGEPELSATLTGLFRGAKRDTIPLWAGNAPSYALPPAYRCAGDKLDAWTAGYVVELHRIGAKG